MSGVFIDSLGIGVRAARVDQVMVNQLIFVRSVANFTVANEDNADAFVNWLASVFDSAGNHQRSPVNFCKSEVQHVRIYESFLKIFGMILYVELEFLDKQTKRPGPAWSWEDDLGGPECVRAAKIRWRKSENGQWHPGLVSTPRRLCLQRYGHHHRSGPRVSEPRDRQVQ